MHFLNVNHGNIGTMLRKLVKSGVSWLLPLMVIVAAIVIYMIKPAQLELLRLRVFDGYQRHQPRDYTPVPVTILDIDEASLQKLGQWPWPRDVLARLVDKLNEIGVAATAFDMVFAEVDRTSPAVLLPEWRDFIPEHAIEGNVPDNDVLFSNAIGASNIVAGTVLSSDSDVQPTRKFGFVEKGNGNARTHLFPYKGAINTLDILTDSASGNGAFTATVDDDGIIRRVPLIMQVGGQLFPSLSAEVLRIAIGASTYIVNTEEGGIVEIAIGDYVIPTDSYGNLWLHYTDETPERYIPVWEILEDDFDAERLAGHIAFLGTSAAGLKDLRSTPLSNITNGVEMHVQAVEQILLDYYLTRPYWISIVELSYMVIAALLVWLVLAKLSPYYGAMCTMLLLGGSVYGSWIAFSQHHMLIDPVSPGIAIILLYFAETLRRYMSAENERKQVRHAFSHYMSPALVEQLASRPESLALGGEMKDMTILFCDIRGFTTISEQFDAQGLTQFINQFLTPMTNIILERQGTIDKYMGDCIMAFWNAPLDDDAHAEHGCRAALAMVAALDVLNAEREVECADNGTEFIPVRIGIGLNSDLCCVGNMGSDQRFDYSVLGDGVNLASRLEGQSKQYGMTIVIGEHTHDALDGFATIELDLIKVKGKTEAVHIFGLLGDEALAEQAEWSSMAEANEDMLLAYRAQDWETALCWLEKMKSMSLELALELDGYLTLYHQRIADYQHMPPPEDWDGVFEATSK